MLLGKLLLHFPCASQQPAQKEAYHPRGRMNPCTFIFGPKRTYKHKRTITPRASTARAAVCARARCGRRWTPLHRAAFNGHANVVEALLARGADVHAKCNYGCGG
jgi:hypothetical protein